MKRITANIKFRKYNSLFISSDVGLVHKTRSQPVDDTETRAATRTEQAPTLSPPMLGKSMWVPATPGTMSGPGCPALFRCAGCSPGGV